MAHSAWQWETEQAVPLRKERDRGKDGLVSNVYSLLDGIALQRKGQAAEGEIMLKHILVILVLALTQTGCSIEEGGGAYNPVPLTEQVRQELEGLKRDFLKIEELKVGSGSLAAWGRKIEADIEVHYIDGTVVYRGPIWMYIGLEGAVWIHDASARGGGLLLTQDGIKLGLNGMAVGGTRKFTIDPSLVMSGLLVQGPQRKNGVGVRKEKLIIEATLTDSCIPRILRFLRVGSSHLIEQEIGCRDADLPKRDPSDPIWRLY